MTASKFVELGRRADRISASSRATKRRAPALGRLILALCCAAGVAGLLQDSWRGLNGAPWADFHLMFGLLLWLTVLVWFSERRNQACPLHTIELRDFRRHLSRVVYLLLYVLFGLNLLIIVGASVWDPRASHATMQDSGENLRDYLAYGLLALLTIHLLAALESRADHQQHK
ncbi:MAG TPA: hypothetical protein VGH12_03485 [Steroidobacteraceae bacterium]